MRIASGVTDQYVYFVAVDATDFTTRETGLSSFTVYRSRNGGASSVMTTPTINETDTSNMPGVYELLLDEDMTIDAGDETQEMVFHVTHAGMAPVTRTIELYRPKITAGNTLGVAADGDISGNLDGTVATVTTLTGHTAQTGDNYARLGAPAGASVSADVAAVKVDTAAILVDTGEIGTAGAGLTNINLPNQTMDIVGNITGNLSGSVGSVTGAVGSVTGNVGGTINGLTATALADFFDTDSGTTYAAALAGSVVKEIADNAGGSALTEAGIADAVWDEALSGHVGAGSAGKAVADIESDVTLVLADTNELQTDWANGGRLDVILDARASQASVDTIDGIVDTILVDTADLQANQGNWLTATGFATSAALATVDGNVDSILVDTGTTLPAQISALENLSAAQVNAEVADVINTDTLAEAAAVPAANASLSAKTAWLATLARNKLEQTATAQTLYDDAGTGTVGVATLSDDGTTAARGEWT